MIENQEVMDLLDLAAKKADNNGTKVIIYSLLAALCTGGTHFERLVNLNGIFTEECLHELREIKNSW